MTSPTCDLPIEVRQRVFQLLESATDRSFEPYLWKPFGAALRERMIVTEITEVEQYLRLLQDDPREVQRLESEALIGVTSFFRNPEAFEALQHHFISRILPLKSPGTSLCVWIPGCSTGQEAYSLAMLLLEINENSGQDLHLRIVASDINPVAISHATAGVYRPCELQSVPDHLRRRFFPIIDGNCVAHDSLRAHLFFLVGDVFSGSPFQEIDLISCRNLLIYFQPTFQNQLLTSFADTLHAEGLLFLGVSEGVVSNSDSFAPLDLEYKIFTRRNPAFYH